MSVRHLAILDKLKLIFHEKGLWLARCVPFAWGWQAILASLSTCRAHRGIDCGGLKIKPCAIAHDGPSDS